MEKRNKALIVKTLKSLLKESETDHFLPSFEVYERLRAASIDVSDASLVLLALLNQAHEIAMAPGSTEEAIAEHLSEHCGLTKESAAWLANICLAVFNCQRQKAVRKESNTQFQEFCSKSWEMHWEGSSIWERDSVFVECIGTARVTFKIVNPTKMQPVLNQLLQQHTQVTSQMIFKYLQDIFAEVSDTDFDIYCSSDDYYPPVAEDFQENFSELIEEMADEYGMQLIDYVFEGTTGNYEHA